jgi:acetoacetyl-CoA synthetase
MSAQEPHAPEIVWQPSPERMAGSAMAALMTTIAQQHGVELRTYADLHRWSVVHPELFWRLVWDLGGVRGVPGDVVLTPGGDMMTARWFPGAQVNYAENLLRARPADAEVIVFRGEDGPVRRLTYRKLHDAVSRFAQGLQAAGVEKGDRVAAYMPNGPDAVIAMLAATALGAVFASASPDFGVAGAVDRFGQITPKVLVTVDGYVYGGKTFPLLDRVREMAGKLPSVERVIVAPFLKDGPAILRDVPKAVWWDDAVAPFRPQRITFERVPFNHPLFILFSSGTTGVPKCIVHGHGGTLLQHLKEHRFHGDIRPGDRVFYFTTCGWMMWNWLVSALASEATLLLYDGSPFHPDGDVLFSYAAAERCTFFGTSAKFIDAAKKAGVRPKDSHDLTALRTIASTGSPLLPESFDYVYDAIKADVHLASISGGTDIIGCFAQGAPILPVRRGELQCAALGMDVAVFDEAGQPVVGAKGELVCRNSFPSMPIGFWNDPNGSKYRGAYFERFPGIWTHGDYAEATPTGGFVIYGRSDATLNPGGVRIGTAEIYRQVEAMPEVVEALAIGQDWAGDVRVVLFVVLKPGATLDDALIARIKTRIREGCTPRHVPAKVIAVPELPRTKSGKLVELAVREVVHGRPVKNIDALANPDALAAFRDLPALAT